jgi:inosine/xanthosine triphosphatase
MIINVGSVNPTKVGAVREVVLNYDFLKDAVVEGVEVASDVSVQPLSVEETVAGAQNRARNAFKKGDYGVGLESGLFSFVDVGRSLRWMNITACAFYSGEQYAVGFSPAFQIPPVMAEIMLREKCEMDEAVHQLGLSSETRVGYHDGFIAILTQGLITRKEYMKPAVQMALVQLQHKERYFLDKK